MKQHNNLSLSDVLIAIALAPVSNKHNPSAAALSVTPKGQHLVNHYIGGYHFFTVAS